MPRPPSKSDLPHAREDGLANAAPTSAEPEGETAPGRKPRQRIDSLELHAREVRLPRKGGGPSEPPSGEHSIPRHADFFRKLAAHDPWRQERRSDAEEVSTELDRADLMQLVTRASTKPPSPVDLGCEMRERFQLGDFTEALRIGELLLGLHPDHADAAQVVRDSRTRLIEMYTAKLGGAHTVLVREDQDEDIRWMGLDHRAGFVLAQVDGQYSLGELLMLIALSELEVLRILHELQQAGLVREKTPR